MKKMEKYPRAIYKDGAVRCEKCAIEIWEGVDCDCGIDGADHPGLKEAYEAKTGEFHSPRQTKQYQEIR